MRKLFCFLLGCLILIGSGQVVRAQSLATADISLIDTQGFPRVAALLDVFDARGQFVTGLQPSNVTILENGQTLPVEELSESAPPLQVVVAVNPGPALAVRDGQGIERFRRITDWLAAWAQPQTGVDTPDDFSLVSIAGPIITHAKPSDWIVSLTSFQPDFGSTTPNVQTMAIALNTVNEPTPLPGMKRAILLITPHMDEPNLDLTLNAFAQQALESRVRVFVWLVDADLFFDNPSATAFRAFALQTGGSYFAFSGLEALPNPETYFSNLRHVYSLSYRSSITVGGEHNLAVQVQTPEGSLSSQPKTFGLDVQPPNPILVAPPSLIVRQAPPDDPFNAELLLPEEQQLELIVEFPDEHPRPLVHSTLLVNGEPAAKNEAEPFDRFRWDLRPYRESAQLQLSVEVLDTLGLSKSSLAVPVTLTVVQAPTGTQAFLAKYRTQIAVGAIGLAGVLLVIILFSGRLRLRTRRERSESRKRKLDPVTQPVDIQQSEPPKAVQDQPEEKQATRLPQKRVVELADAPAALLRLGENGEILPGTPILLQKDETSFGTDPTKAEHVLDHPSIDALHARIRKSEAGDYLLIDNDSVAGTWVNYDQTPKEGNVLKHGDVVHFGQLIYRFTLRTHPPDSDPIITPETQPE